MAKQTWQNRNGKTEMAKQKLQKTNGKTEMAKQKLQKRNGKTANKNQNSSKKVPSLIVLMIELSMVGWLSLFTEYAFNNCLSILSSYCHR